jgi:CubicO group peptidase (beta-lactamase class C family)
MATSIAQGEAAQTGEPGYAALVSCDGENLKCTTQGLADVSKQARIDLETPFQIGSLTKPFTATAIMLLAERKSLDIAAPITDFVPGLPGGYRTISVRHLLNHTSGIPNYTDLAGFWIHYSDRDVSPIEAVRYFTAPPLRFAPGAQFEYSNSGYILLGLVVERVTGVRFGNFLQAEFFDPLAMNCSALLPDSSNPHVVAQGYKSFEGAYRDADSMSLTWPYASGSLVSSANDLMKWQTAVRNADFISHRTLSAMLVTPRFADGSTSVYGSGWAIGSTGGEMVAYHSGSIRGFASYMAWHTSRSLQVVVLSNIQDFPAQRLGESLLSEFV